MNSVLVHSISGLYYKLYHPEPEALSNKYLDTDDNTIDINMLSWQHVLSMESVTNAA